MEQAPRNERRGSKTWRSRALDTAPYGAQQQRGEQNADPESPPNDLPQDLRRSTSLWRNKRKERFSNSRQGVRR